VQQNPRPRGLGLITDFINASSPARVKLMKHHIDWVDIPSSGAHTAYGPAEAAIVEAFGAPKPDVILDRMVHRAPENMRRHYDELSAGAVRLIARKKMATAPVGVPIRRLDRLQVRLNHIVGLVDPKGNKYAAFLYYKEPELTADAVAIVTRLIETEMPRVLPGATPVALDVRRGKMMKRSPRRRLDDLDMAIRCEVRAYVDLWDEVRVSMLPT
jgi:hypothetical protein